MTFNNDFAALPTLPASVLMTLPEYDEAVNINSVSDMELPPVDVYINESAEPTDDHDVTVSVPRKEIVFKTPAMVELSLMDFYPLLHPRLKPNMTAGQKCAAVFFTIQEDFSKHLFVIRGQLTEQMEARNKADKTLRNEKKRCAELEALNREYTENAVLIAENNLIIAETTAATRDILSSMIAFSTLPVSKEMKKRGMDIGFKALSEIRSVILDIYRDDAYHHAGDNKRMLHPAVVAGWCDSPMLDITRERNEQTNTQSGYIELLKKQMATMKEVEPQSKLDKAEDSIYTNELMILSEQTEWLLKEMINETGWQPNTMADDFATAKAVFTQGVTRIPFPYIDDEGKPQMGHEIKRVTKTVPVITDEETQVATIRAALSILEDDRNFTDSKGNPRGKQHTFDRLRLIDMVAEELYVFCNTDVRKHRYSLGDGRNTTSFTASRIEKAKTAAQIAHDRDYTDTMYVVEVKRDSSVKRTQWKVVSYGRAKILSEKYFGQELQAQAQVQYGKEARVHFERW